MQTIITNIRISTDDEIDGQDGSIHFDVNGSKWLEYLDVAGDLEVTDGNLTCNFEEAHEGQLDFIRDTLRTWLGHYSQIHVAVNGVPDFFVIETHPSDTVEAIAEMIEAENREVGGSDAEPLIGSQNAVHVTRGTGDVISELSKKETLGRVA